MPISSIEQGTEKNSNCRPKIYATTTDVTVDPIETLNFLKTANKIQNLRYFTPNS